MKKLILSLALGASLAFGFVPTTGFAQSSLVPNTAPSVATGLAHNACARLFAPAQPRLFIVSAPSGAGKTTLLKKLMDEYPGQFAVSVSTTTRGPRPGEVDGTDYNFTTVAKFQEQIKAGDFVEWAEVHGNYYGTSKSMIENNLRDGKSVFLNINVDGAETIRKAFPGRAEGIFVSPPSLEILEARLRGRGTETEANIQKRLAAARDEMKHVNKFENVIVNDNLEKAYAELRKLVAPK
jgi:guanylate kinase